MPVYAETIKRFVACDAFQKALQVRPCNTFDPIPAMQVTEYSDRPGYGDITMKPEGKALWFNAWLAQNNLQGKIMTEVAGFQQITPEILLVYAKATVIIGGDVIAEDVAGRAVMVTDLYNLDNAIQIAASVAKGRALSNAGFGACCSAYNVELGADLSTIQFGNEVNPPLPFVYPNQQNMPQGSPSPAPQSVSVLSSAQQVMQSSTGTNASQTGGKQLPRVFQGESDEILRAKAMIWPYNGQYKGQTLGEILATRPNQIIWMATKCTDAAFCNAAKLLLPEANAQTGRA